MNNNNNNNNDNSDYQPYFGYDEKNLKNIPPPPQFTQFDNQKNQPPNSQFGQFNSQMNQPPSYALKQLTPPPERTWIQKYGNWILAIILVLILFIAILAKITSPEYKAASLPLTMLKIAKNGATAKDIKSIKNFYLVLDKAIQKDCKNKTKDEIDYIVCSGNLYKLGIASMIYKMDNKGKNPPDIDCLAKPSSSKCSEPYIDLIPTCPCGGKYEFVKPDENESYELIIRCNNGKHTISPPPEFNTKTLDK